MRKNGKWRETLEMPRTLEIREFIAITKWF
jgi:hypothetical protein